MHLNAQSITTVKNYVLKLWGVVCCRPQVGSELKKYRLQLFTDYFKYNCF